VQSSFLPKFKTLPYGVNAMVAIMCYTGYNTEDAILFNRGALERGMFNTSYFKTYEMYESSDGESELLFQGGTNFTKMSIKIQR
jgi:DNA-directed RNA polymerase beta subunit